MAFRTYALGLLSIALCSEQVSAGCAYSIHWDGIHNGQVVPIPCQEWNTDHCDIHLEAGDSLRVGAGMNCWPGTIEWSLDGTVFLTVTGNGSMQYLTHSGEYSVRINSNDIPNVVISWHLTIPNANDPETSDGPFAVITESPEASPLFMSYDASSSSIVGHLPTAATGLAPYGIFSVDGRSLGRGSIPLTAGDGNFSIDVGPIPESLVIVEVRLADQVFRSKLFLP